MLLGVNKISRILEYSVRPSFFLYLNIYYVPSTIISIAISPNLGVSITITHRQISTTSSASTASLVGSFTKVAVRISPHCTLAARFRGIIIIYSSKRKKCDEICFRICDGIFLIFLSKLFLSTHLYV